MRTANRPRLFSASRRRRTSASKYLKLARLLTAFSSFFLLTLAAAPHAAGQTTGSATLRVIVQDPQGAVVPGATVTVTFERTGDRRNAPTSGEGTATFASLPPGWYVVRVESTNFKAFEQRIELYPSDTRGLEANLEVGPPI